MRSPRIRYTTPPAISSANMGCRTTSTAIRRTPRRCVAGNSLYPWDFSRSAASTELRPARGSGLMGAR